VHGVRINTDIISNWTPAPASRGTRFASFSASTLSSSTPWESDPVLSLINQSSQINKQSQHRADQKPHLANRNCGERCLNEHQQIHAPGRRSFPALLHLSRPQASSCNQRNALERQYRVTWCANLERFWRNSSPGHPEQHAPTTCASRCEQCVPGDRSDARRAGVKPARARLDRSQVGRRPAQPEKP
jgi:hypothetical protein